MSHLLIVDDEEDNRELLRLMFDEKGFEVRTANDGQKAIAAFESWKPDFIWMDLRMPLTDGFASTKAIRLLPGGIR